MNDSSSTRLRLKSSFLRSGKESIMKLTSVMRGIWLLASSNSSTRRVSENASLWNVWISLLLKTVFQHRWLVVSKAAGRAQERERKKMYASLQLISYRC